MKRLTNTDTHMQIQNIHKKTHTHEHTDTCTHTKLTFAQPETTIEGPCTRVTLQ